MDEGVVEGGQDVADTKCVFGLFSGSSNGGSVVRDLLFFGAFFTFLSLLLLLSLRL